MKQYILLMMAEKAYTHSLILLRAVWVGFCSQEGSGCPSCMCSAGSDS